MIRKAVPGDIPAVAAIYGRIHDREEAGAGTTGWKRGVYPTEATAREALAADVLFVDEREGRIVAAARIDQVQVPEYALARWQYAAEAREIMVLHTLVVDPDAAGQGIGTGFVAFYERYARERGCPCLRMDTNEINAPARALRSVLAEGKQRRFATRRGLRCSTRPVHFRTLQIPEYIKKKLHNKTYNGQKTMPPAFAVFASLRRCG